MKMIFPMVEADKSEHERKLKLLILGNRNIICKWYEYYLELLNVS